MSTSTVQNKANSLLNVHSSVNYYFALDFYLLMVEHDLNFQGTLFLIEQLKIDKELKEALNDNTNIKALEELISNVTELVELFDIVIKPVGYTVWVPNVLMKVDNKVKTKNSLGVIAPEDLTLFMTNTDSDKLNLSLL